MLKISLPPPAVGRGTKKYRNSEFGSRFNVLHMVVEELTFCLFFSECLAALLGIIVPKEKGVILCVQYVAWSNALLIVLILP